VTPSPELEAEGTARDVIREVQQARKEAGLHVSDRIDLGIASTADVLDAVTTHLDRVKDAVLALDVELVPIAEEVDPAWMGRWQHVRSTDPDGSPLTIGIRVHTR
jgi:isoleucyl-tRNA synthetase